MKKYIVHLDRWSQMPAHNHVRTARPFREALAEASDVLGVGDNKTDIARLYPAGTRGWLTPGREVVAFRRTSTGHLVPQINPKVQP